MNFPQKLITNQWGVITEISHLGLPVDFVVPLEIWCDRQFDSQSGPRDRLDVHGQFQLGQLVDVLMDRLPTLGHADQLSDLVRIKIVEPLPRKVLLFDLLDDVFRNFLELPQRAHRLPHSSVDHLAECQRLVGQLRPAAIENDLVYGSHQTRGRLRYEDHIGHESEPFEFQLRDVRLQQDVHLTIKYNEYLFSNPLLEFFQVCIQAQCECNYDKHTLKPHYTMVI